MTIKKVMKNMGEGIIYEQDLENETDRIYVEDDVQGDVVVDLDEESEDWYDEDLMEEARGKVDDLFRSLGVVKKRN